MEDNRLDAVPALVQSTASLLDCVHIDGIRLLKLEARMKRVERRTLYLYACIFGLILANVAQVVRIIDLPNQAGEGHRLPTWVSLPEVRGQGDAIAESRSGPSQTLPPSDRKR